MAFRVIVAFSPLRDEGCVASSVPRAGWIPKGFWEIFVLPELVTHPVSWLTSGVGR